MPLPPPSGAVTFEFRKNSGEMALVDEAAHQSDVRQSEPISEQQLPSPLDSFSNQPLVRRYARRLAESACKIAGRQSTFMRKLCNGRVVTQTRGKKIEHAPELPGRQSSRRQIIRNDGVAVGSHDVSVKGERDVVDKQGAMLGGALDMVEKRIRQSVHNPVTRTQQGG